jgi:methylenetetrahydrofolate dehydrogenase (NADP+) / methenyltetrahydrofolate cyclohydrolase
MTAAILSGTKIAKAITREQKAEVDRLVAEKGVRPGLATVLVGEDPASAVYVSMKQKRAAEIGLHSVHDHLPASTTQAELLARVAELNRDPAVHGILVQLPLPKQIDEKTVLLAIDPSKDVDAFHPVNVGRLLQGDPVFEPCTPAGVRELLLRGGVKMDGADVVIVGRSNIVGKPLAAMLMQKAAGANATVTVVHTRTRDMAAHTRRAEVLIVAAGKPRAVTADMVKPGAAVIDVGVNRLPDGSLCGDVDYDAVKEVAGLITPVPGGVGPMTITMLMANTIKAAKMGRK